MSSPPTDIRRETTQALRLDAGSVRCVLALLALACAALCWFAPPVAGQDRAAAEGAERRLADYEKELQTLIRERRRMARAFLALTAENQQLQAQLQMQVARAESSLALAAQIPSTSRVRSVGRDRNGDRVATERVVDNTGTKSAMAAGAMRLMANLSLAQGSLTVRNNQALAKLAADSEKNSRDGLELADLFGRRGVAEAERAIELLGDALVGDPQHAAARIIYASALVRLGRFDEAEEEFSILASIPGPLAVVSMAARGYLRQVLLPGASDELRREGAADIQRALSAKSRQPEPLLWRALVSWEAERWTLAEADLKAALRLAPDHIDSLRLMARFRATKPGNEMDLDEAETAARRAVELTLSNSFACLESLAIVQSKRGDWAGATETAERAAKLASGPDVARLQALAAEFRAERGVANKAPRWTFDMPVPKLTPADQVLRDILRTWRDPDTEATPLQCLYRARALAGDQRWTAAMGCYLQASSLPNPFQWDLWFEYGCAAWLAGEKREYAELCQTLLGRMPANRTFLLLASATADSGAPPLPVLAALRQQGADAGVTLPLAAYRAGQFAEARELARAHLRSIEAALNPSLSQSQSVGVAEMILALLDANVGNAESARGHAKAAHRHLPDEPPRFNDKIVVGPQTNWLVLKILDRELEQLLKEAK